MVDRDLLVLAHPVRLAAEVASRISSRLRRVQNNQRSVCKAIEQPCHTMGLGYGHFLVLAHAVGLAAELRVTHHQPPAWHRTKHMQQQQAVPIVVWLFSGRLAMLQVSALEHQAADHLEAEVFVPPKECKSG